MISRDNILKLETRRDIYEYILKNPGLHLRELSRRKNISIGSIGYHLNFLTKIGLIISRKEHGFVRYYVKTTVGKKDKEIINILRHDIPRRIIMLLLIPGPGNIYVDEKTQEKKLTNISSHMKIYSKEELIDLTKYWDRPYKEFFLLKKHPSTVNFHLNKLLEVGLIEKIRIGRKMKYKIKDEDFVWALFIKYREALSVKSIDLLLSWRNYTIIYAINNMMEVVWDIFPHPYHA